MMAHFAHHPGTVVKVRDRYAHGQPVQQVSFDLDAQLGQPERWVRQDGEECNDAQQVKQPVPQIGPGVRHLCYDEPTLGERGERKRNMNYRIGPILRSEYTYTNVREQCATHYKVQPRFHVDNTIAGAQYPKGAEYEQAAERYEGSNCFTE